MGKQSERGAALLLLFLMIFMLAAGVVLARWPANPRLRREEDILRQLQEAKEALLAYAITYEDNYANRATGYYPPPGYLPCPNLDLPEIDESPNPPCHNRRPIIGRLPRRFPSGEGNVYESFPAGNQRGEELWYALSRGFQNNRAPDRLNSTSPGQLTVDGQSGIVAIVFAPGPPVAAQRRATTDVRDYLESENADGDNEFTAVGAGSNDRLLFITQRELATQLSRRVAADVKQVLDRVFDRDGAYPPDLPPGLPPWFPTNWQPITSYRSAGATAALRFDGCRIAFSLQRAVAAPVQEGATCQ